MKLRILLSVSALAGLGWLAATAPSLAVPNAVSTQAVNARSCGSTDCEVLYLLPAGTQVEVIATQNGWCQSEWTGYPTAWISCQYLAALGTQQRAPTSNTRDDDDDDDDDDGGYY